MKNIVEAWRLLGNTRKITNMISYIICQDADTSTLALQLVRATCCDRNPGHFYRLGSISLKNTCNASNVVGGEIAFLIAYEDHSVANDETLFELDCTSLKKLTSVPTS